MSKTNHRDDVVRTMMRRFETSMTEEKNSEPMSRVTNKELSGLREVFTTFYAQLIYVVDLL